MSAPENDRAISAVIGAVILFGAVVILFAVYQATIVPSENEQVEFDHSRTVQNDMLELRNAILESDNTGERTFATVKLGTRYEPRLFAINPPPAGGGLRTGTAEEITVTNRTGASVSNLCPSSGPIQTRTLRYSAGYNEYRNAPTIVYENTVLYLNFSDGNIMLTDEELVQGDTVNVSPLNTSLDEFGVDSVSIEPVPGLVKTKEVEGANVTLPTQLSEGTWEDLLSEDVDASNVSVTDGRLSLNQSSKIEVRCAPLGLNQQPAGGSRTGGAVDINPVGPNDIEIRSFNRPGNDQVEVTFNNTASTDANVTEARLTFYNNPSDTGGDIGPIDFIDQNGNTVATLEVLGPRETTDPEVNFPGNETETTVTFENPGGEKFAQDDFFVLELVFANGKEGTYFIDVPA